LFGAWKKEGWKGLDLRREDNDKNFEGVKKSSEEARQPWRPERLKKGRIQKRAWLGGVWGDQVCPRTAWEGTTRLQKNLGGLKRSSEEGGQGEDGPRGTLDHKKGLLRKWGWGRATPADETGPRDRATKRETTKKGRRCWVFDLRLRGNPRSCRRRVLRKKKSETLEIEPRPKTKVKKKKSKNS